MSIPDKDKLFAKLEAYGEEAVRVKLAQGVFAPKSKIDLVNLWLSEKEKEAKKQMNEFRIFLSHITDESNLALKLKEWIEDSFIDRCKVFVSSDSESIPPGSRWLDKITNALEDAKIMMVLCSPHSITKPWINFEAGCGWIKNISVIPICHSGLTKSKLPPPLSSLQAVELNSKEFASTILSTIASNLGMSKTPRVNQELINVILAAEKTVVGKSDMVESYIPHGELNEGDIKAILENWFMNMTIKNRQTLINYADIDNKLNLPIGSTKQHLKQIAANKYYEVSQEGASTVLFKYSPLKNVGFVRRW